MKKFIIVILTLIILSSVVLSGCNLGQPGASPAPGSSSTPGATLAPGNSPKPGVSSSSGTGVLNLSGVDPYSLDPAIVSEMTSHQYVGQIYSGLLQVGDNLQPAADIAQSWDISTDGLTYTFHLRSDAKFQDGRAVTAADFKYSWERAANPATKSQTAGSYLGDIVGVNDMLAGKANQLSGVKVIDDYTLQVTIDSPKSYFLSKMTYTTSFLVDKNNVASGSDWWRKPNGTGPFKLGQWTQNQSLTLVRNDYYYGTKPQISQVKYQFYTGLPMDLFETSQIDITDVSLSYIDEVLDKSGPYYQNLTTTPEFSFYYIGFNCTKPPFDDANIRRAFSMAIDKDKIVSLVFKDMVQKANGLLPPGLPGYNPNLTGVSFDATQAQNLIKASKYGDVSKLPPIILTTSGYGGGVGSTLQALVYQWKQNLGVDVQIRQLEPERLLYNLQAEVDQMFDMGWVADYPHPQDFVDILFNSNSENNYGQYSNKEVDNLIQQANQALDSNQSFALYQQAEQKIINDAACVPISFGKNYVLAKPYVKGYSITPLGIANLAKVTITPH